MPKNKGNVVGLNFFPPSCDTGDPRFWNSNSDGAIAMANCLAYAGGSSVLRKRRTPSKRSLEIKSDGASESRVCLLCFHLFAGTITDHYAVTRCPRKLD